MSKRKNRAGGPSIPRETLERARRQAGLEQASDSAPEPEPEPEVPAAENPFRTISASQRRAQRAVRSGGRTSEPSRRTRAADKLDQESVAHLLHNPTRFVSEEELRRDYSYVLSDLRSMGLLAAGLVALLVVLAQVLPK